MSRRAAAPLATALCVLVFLSLLAGASPAASAPPTVAPERAAGGGQPEWRAAAERRERAARREALDLGSVVGDKRRPNILVLMLDDMRDDDLRFMPNVRRLITEQGVRFTNSFSPHPLCCPARASFLTGEYTHNHEVWTHRPPYGFQALDDRETLPVWLSEVGYQTMFLGKYLNGYGRQQLETGGPSLRYVPPGWTDWRASADKRGTPTGPLRGGTYGYFDSTLSVNGTLEPHQGVFQTHLYSGIAQEMIREAALSPNPFFSWISFTTPHAGSPREEDDPEPVTWPRGNLQRFPSPARPDYVKGRFDDEVTRIPGADAAADRIAEKPYTIRRRPPLSAEEQAAVLEVLRQRAEAISVVDDEVANIIASLRRTGQLDDTYVMLTSDNGFFLGEHRMRLGKILPYDPALRVPLVIRGPGVPAGEVRTDPFRTIDLAPTLLDMAGAQPRPDLDGISGLDVARDGDRGWTRGILTETGPRVVEATVEDRAGLFSDTQRAWRLRFSIGLRTGSYLYVDNADGVRELYDLRTDPRQLDNLADEPGHRRLVRVLARELERLRDCSGPGCRVPLPPLLRTDDPVTPQREGRI